MSDRFSDVLTIDYLLLTSNTFATEQNSKYKVVSSSKESPQELSDKPSYLPAKDKDIQSDQPFRPFSPEQFDLVSAETVETTRVAQRRNEKMKIIRKQQRDRLVNKPIKRLRKHIENVFEFCAEYERSRYIQLHNKFQSLRLTLTNTGTTTATNKEITKFSVFSQVYSPVDKGVYLYNVGYCAFLCVRTSGQLYSREILSSECLFSTSGRKHDITDSDKLVSLEHSNSTHKLYVSLSQGGLRGVVIADSVLNNTQVRRTEHTRDWIFIPVDFAQLRAVFRPKDLPFIANRRGLEEFYCPKIKKRRQERRNKSCSKLKRGKKKCRENLCIKKREKNNSDVTCTQKERDKKFGRGWKWNTRDCSSLPRRREVKKCRREKRRRCIRRHKAGGVTKQQAKLRCKSRG